MPRPRPRSDMQAEGSIAAAERQPAGRIDASATSTDPSRFGSLAPSASDRSFGLRILSRPTLRRGRPQDDVLVGWGDGRRRIPGTATIILLAIAFVRPVAAQTHTEDRPRAVAVERTTPIVLDGVLGEAAWSGAVPAADFRQFEPREGVPASQRTEVRFVFDGEALYVGARMYDSLGARGVRTRLVRRDQVTEGDYLELVFDTFHDHAGRTVFTLNPSGVKDDAGQAAPGADPSWDPVWEYAARVDSLGWTAEARIPWSQLRFGRDTLQTWGMQLWRTIERLNETDMWAPWGRQESGGPPRFGHLEGIRVRSRPRGIEVMPYLLTRASYVAPTQPGSPFQAPRRYDARAGADLRMLLGSSLTLSATVNPDFGQVEQDPAVVNLSAFESYFDEKRPFFVEGSGLLFFGGFECFSCSSSAGMNVFYSRRIGRAPQGAVPDGYAYAEVPRNTRLLAAAKLTGRTGGGWEMGMLEAATAREVARVQAADGARGEVPVEPFTNYWLGRVKRTTRGGRATWGVMATSVVRRFGAGDGALEGAIPAHAEALGADWSLTSPGQAYRLIGNVVLSDVRGDSLAIARLQRSSARWFQRPDREGGGNGLFSDAYDTGAEGLRGFGGYLRVSRDQGPWLWEAMANVRSPGFEVNDIAFLQRADYVWTAAAVEREWTKPGRWTRSVLWNFGAQQQHNFDGDRTDLELHSFGQARLRSGGTASLSLRWRPAELDDRLTRGGATVRHAWNALVRPTVTTDSRARVVLSVSPAYSPWGDGSRLLQLGGTLRLKPATNVELQVAPLFNDLVDRGQYVAQFKDPSAVAFFGRRAVFAEMRQRTLAVATQASWTFSPALTLELFAQPFVSSGRYRGFQEYVRPRSGERAYFDTLQLRVAARDAQGRPTRYVLDPDRDPSTADFEIDNPDFSLRSLRGSAVVRWEYRPGSTLFFVWQQEREGSGPDGDFDPGRDLADVFRRRPDNVFVIKASYWIAR